MGTRKVTPPSSEIIPIRPSSPVLIPSNPLPTHFSPLLEEDTGRCVCVCVCGGGGGGGEGVRRRWGGKGRGGVGLYPCTVHYVVAVFESQE